MIDQFEYNLSLVLAHSVMFEAKADVPDGVPHDWAKNWSNDPDIRSTGESASNVLSTLQGRYPEMADLISNKNLEIAQKTAPGYAQLAWDTMYPQLPKMSWLQSNMYSQNAPILAGAEASADQAVLSKYGPDLVNRTMALDQTLNPEYYATRQQTANTIGQLMSGKLTDAENEAISRQLLGNTVNRGLAGVPSNINTVSNAMLYGDAAWQRQVQGAQMATSFLPVSRSGLDAQNIALGNKNWQSKFLGVGDTSGVTGASQQGNATTAALGSSILGNVFDLQKQNVQNRAEASTPYETALSSVSWL